MKSEFVDTKQGVNDNDDIEIISGTLFRFIKASNIIWFHNPKRGANHK